jgi:hypothetical protein
LVTGTNCQLIGDRNSYKPRLYFSTNKRKQYRPFRVCGKGTPL